MHALAKADTVTTIYPSIDELKAQARRLRQAMAERGNDIAHSAALELVAKQHGLRDWNTLSALAAKPNVAPSVPFAVGSAVRGRYLNQPFTGKVLALSEQAGGLHKITIHFDEPVDVVTFESFSAFRRRINAQIDADGISPRKTSDGVPHLLLDI
ncbi:hypothetical protein RRH01S_02_01840 [Rhizobium rhizogenes NBRC 13257]|uniref:Glyoxalase-related protein domain-containing protein n=2 Tax=Rhizobium rhizogenes TaxID=359 RepID=B9JC45_RHIR8|nr:conserved hypothetical protein [Rhizobium rhizogenes K84]GAJ91516.1 hypothetical protein RRH01S_02_01840 [Rhizobium rhizogenes NBRC 13257]